MSEARYLQFPLCLLQETYEDPEDGLNLIIDFGIANFATKQTYSLRDVARQLMYFFYRSPDQLPGKVAKAIQDGVTIDEDYEGFMGEEFAPDESIPEVLLLIDRDAYVRDIAVKWYQLHCAAGLLKINIGSYSRTWDQHTKGISILRDFEAKHGKDVWPSCRTGMLFDFRDNLKDLHLFRAYTGLKSLTGRKSFVSTCKSIILQRMCGAKSQAALNDAIQSPAMQGTFERYSRRRQMDGLLRELQEKNFILKLPVARRLYITTNGGISFDEFLKMIANDQWSNDVKRREQAAREHLKMLMEKR